MMLRVRLLLLLCCMPALSPAADAPALACGEGGRDPAFVPSEGRALTRDEARDVVALFRRLDGHWRGTMVEQVCMVSGATRIRRFDVELELTRSGDDLLLAGEYVQRPGGATRVFRRRLLITPDGLRVDQATRAGEVELLVAGLGGLSYMQRFRVVQRMAPPKQPRQPAGGSATTPEAGATTSEADAQSAQASSVVVGSDSLPVGEPTAGDAARSNSKPKPKRRSLSRAERFTLLASGSRRLVMVQDHYTQGVYGGTMRWELRRR